MYQARLLSSFWTPSTMPYWLCVLSHHTLASLTRFVCQSPISAQVDRLPLCKASYRPIVRRGSIIWHSRFSYVRVCSPLDSVYAGREWEPRCCFQRWRQGNSSFIGSKRFCKVTSMEIQILWYWTQVFSNQTLWLTHLALLSQTVDLLRMLYRRLDFREQSTKSVLADLVYLLCWLYCRLKQWLYNSHRKDSSQKSWLVHWIRNC